MASDGHGGYQADRPRDAIEQLVQNALQRARSIDGPLKEFRNAYRAIKNMEVEAIRVRQSSAAVMAVIDTRLYTVRSELSTMKADLETRVMDIERVLIQQAGGSFPENHDMSFG